MLQTWEVCVKILERHDAEFAIKFQKHFSFLQLIEIHYYRLDFNVVIAAQQSYHYEIQCYLNPSCRVVYP